MENQYLSQLADRCAGHARQLSYDTQDGGKLKHTLREASHALDTSCVRVHKKTDGLLMINLRGKARYMTWRERLAYSLLGGKTEIRP